MASLVLVLVALAGSCHTPLGRTSGTTLYPGAGLLQRETYTQVMAVRGVVFDITSGKEFYGRNSPTVP